MPTISDAERVDIETLQEAVKSAKIRAYDLMREFMRMDSQQLEHCGHKSVASAMEATMARTAQEIRNLDKAYLRKWPD